MSNLNRHRREAERYLRRAEGLKIETTKGLRAFEDFRFAVEQLLKTLDVALNDIETERDKRNENGFRK